MKLEKDDEILIVGQGLAGTCLAWRLWDRGMKFRIVDRGGKPGNSAVAVGMVSPVVGPSMDPVWRLGEFLKDAMEFYRKTEMVLGEKYFCPIPVLRLFGEARERQRFESKKDELAPWTEEVLDTVGGGVHGEFGGVVWTGGGWFRLMRFIEASKGYFREHGLYEQREVHDEELRGGKYAVTILCEGAGGLGSGVFGYLPEQSAKGEVLTVRVPGLDQDRILSRGGWMIPRGGGLFRAGSGYDRNDRTKEPTAKGRAQVEDIIRSLTPLHFEVLDHVAGVRPIIESNRPVIGWHPDDASLGIFNGLGSKGTLYAPGVAKRFAQHLCDGIAVDPDLDVARMRKDAHSKV